MPSSGVPARSTLPGTAGVFGHLLGSENLNSSLKLRKRTGWVITENNHDISLDILL